MRDLWEGGLKCASDKKSDGSAGHVVIFLYFIFTFLSLIGDQGELTVNEDGK